jgi:hypothetical protein
VKARVRKQRVISTSSLECYRSSNHSSSLCTCWRLLGRLRVVEVVRIEVCVAIQPRINQMSMHVRLALYQTASSLIISTHRLPPRCPRRIVHRPSRFQPFRCPPSEIQCSSPLFCGGDRVVVDLLLDLLVPRWLAREEVFRGSPWLMAFRRGRLNSGF